MIKWNKWFVDQCTLRCKFPSLFFNANAKLSALIIQTRDAYRKALKNAVSLVHPWTHSDIHIHPFYSIQHSKSNNFSTSFSCIFRIPIIKSFFFTFNLLNHNESPGNSLKDCTFSRATPPFIISPHSIYFTR